MKLVATTTIKHGPEGQTAKPGDTFEIDEKKYPESVAQLLESGDAAKPGSAAASSAGTPAAGSVPAPAPAVASGPLPDDFPGRAALAADGINTYGQLRSAGDVTAVPGIGTATADKIKAALADADKGQS